MSNVAVPRWAKAADQSCSGRCVLSWVRTRWALLLVFWLGWLFMLLGAVVIILQAPRCRDLPVTYWWNDGPLYQIGSIRAFSDAQNLKGEKQEPSPARSKLPLTQVFVQVWSRRWMVCLS